MAGKNKKLSVLSDNDEDALSKLGKKHRSEAVTGQPDQSDIDNITELLRAYEKSNPGKLAKMKQDYDTQVSLSEKVKVPSVKGITSHELTFSFWMPRDLQEFMEVYYPTLWTNKAHMDWFTKRFPIFKA